MLLIGLTLYCEHFVPMNIIFSVECVKFCGCTFHQYMSIAVRKVNL